MSDPKLQFTLRSHAESVTSILHIPTTQQLLTADTSGLLILWNLITRRPVRCWQGHKLSVLTLLQLDHTHILTHSRDSELKIWDLEHIKTKSNEEEIIEEFSMPVNTTNFSNVVYLNDGYLITPATIDSNNFDVYKLSNNDDGSGWGVRRIITNFSAYNLVHGGAGVVDGEVGARGDFGIIMKMIHIDDVIYIGFESGDIVGVTIDFNIPPVSKTTNSSTDSSGSGAGGGGGGLSKLFKEQSRTIINRDPKITLTYHNSTHAPNPIISLSNHQGHLISGSTNNKIAIHPNNEIFKVNESGIHGIATLSNQMIVGYWNGTIQGYDIEKKTCQWTISRELPRIKTMTANQGGMDESEAIAKGEIKLSYMILSATTMASDGDNKKSYASMIRRRKNIDSQVLFAGYEDGTINVFKIT